MRSLVALWAILAVTVLGASRACHHGSAFGLSSTAWGCLGAAVAIAGAFVVPALLARAWPGWTAREAALPAWVGYGGVAALWLLAIGAVVTLARGATHASAWTWTLIVSGATLFFVSGAFAAAGGDRLSLHTSERQRRFYEPTARERDADSGVGAIVFVVGVAVLFVSHARLLARSPVRGLVAFALALAWLGVVHFGAAGLTR